MNNALCKRPHFSCKYKDSDILVKLLFLLAIFAACPLLSPSSSLLLLLLIPTSVCTDEVKLNDDVNLLLLLFAIVSIS